MDIFRHQYNRQCLIVHLTQVLRVNKLHPPRQIKFNIHQFHFFHSKFFIYKPISINFKFNEKYNNIELKKVNCGKILNVLTKSWSVETRNLTKSRVTQGGFLLKCVCYSQSLDGDVQFHSPTYVCHYNKATTCNHK